MPSVVRSVTFLRGAVLLTVTALSLGACRRRRPEPPAPAAQPTVNQDSIDAENRRRAAEEERRRREAAVADSIRRANEARSAAMAEARNTLLAAVYFDYDMAEIRDDARASLEAKLPLLNANPGLRLRIAGHTDARGSDEYNLALGQRRAASVKSFFSERGVDASRLEIVSFGEERGTCTEEAESCWSRNRRAEFEITAGGDALTIPGRAQ